jgi:ElaB/YqjD/DUF883 family membrane-anchored ribosome-binding protein
MISHRREQVTDRFNDAADSVKQVLNDARDRGSDVLDAAHDAVDAARSRFGSSQVSLAEQLETAAASLRRNAGSDPISRLTRERPVPAVVVAFAVGALVGALGSMLLAGVTED